MTDKPPVTRKKSVNLVTQLLRPFQHKDDIGKRKDLQPVQRPAPSSIVDETTRVVEKCKIAAPGQRLIIELAEGSDVGDAKMKTLLGRLKELSSTFNSTRPEDGCDDEKMVKLNNDLKDVRDMREILKVSLKAPTSVTISEWIDKVDQALYLYKLSCTQSDRKDSSDGVTDEGEIQLSSSSECCCSRDPNIIAYSLDIDGLDSLFHAIDAGFDASVGRARCLAGTRVDILRHLRDWSSKPDSSNILWLSGDAGCGKSTVMQSFAEQLFVDDKLGASFFCSRDSWSRSDPERILPTLAYQLATSKNQATPMFRSALIDALVENPDSESLSQRNQLQKLIIGPLQESAMEAVIVVDGLDECRDLQGISNVLSLLFDASSSVPQVKFVFATRKDHDIASEMNREGIDKLQINIADDANIHDLSLFLRTEVLRVIRLDGSRVEAWEMLDKLLEAANGSFIFASTAIRFMSQGKGEQAYLLRLLQGGDPSQIKGRSVDMLYSAILDRAAPVAADVGRFREDLRSLLALLVVASHPLSLRAAKELLSCDQRFHLRDASPALSSVLQIPESDTSAITFWHRSFSDFLTGEPHTGSTASGSSFYVDQKHWHRDITQRCFEQMKERLSRNICGLRRYANNHGPNTAELLDQNISEATRYCCRHWIDHLVCNNEKDLEENPANLTLLDDFLTKRQLLWFEALTLLGDLHRAAPLLAKVYIWLKNMEPDNYERMLPYVIAGQKFLSNASEAIGVSVRHIYHSALPFSADPLFANLLDREPEAKVLLGRGDDPRAIPIRTITVPDWVRSLHYSRDGSKLAVGGDGFSFVYAAVDSAEVNRTELESSYYSVRSVSFSSGSSKQNVLVTTSDETIKVWDVNQASDKPVTELPQRKVLTVAFHPSRSALLLVCDSSDSLFLWDLDSDKRQCQGFENIENFNGANCWHSDSPTKELRILIGKYDGTMAIHTIGQHTDQTLKSNGERLFSPPSDDDDSAGVSVVASSHSGDLVASGLFDATVLVYCAESTNILRVIHTSSGRYEYIRSLQFAPVAGARLLAYTAGHNAYLCSIGANADDLLKSVYKHDDDVRCAVFSPDGHFMATGGDDGLIKIWSLEHHSLQIGCFDVSNDGTLYATGSDDKTVRIWAVVDGSVSLQQVLRGHTSTLDDVIFLQDNSHLISIDQDAMIIVWGLQGKSYSQLSHEVSSISPYDSYNIRYTHNSKGFFSCSSWRTRRVECWTLSGTQMVLAAQGALPGHERVADIGHIGLGSDVILVLECSSGNHLLAYWEGANEDPPNEPLVLSFKSAPVGFAEISRTRVEKMSHYLVKGDMSMDEEWILGKENQKILWVPDANRGSIMWWDKRRLILAGRTGLLTIVDFANVDVELPSDTRYGTEEQQTSTGF